MRIDKDEYFIEITKTVAKRSTCLSRQVGCVLVDKNGYILATGYNGPPKNQDHCKNCIRKQTNNIHLCRAIHAEQNALLQCKNVMEIEKAYISFSPCNTCIKLFLNTSCKEIIYLEDYRENDFIFENYNFDNLKIHKYKQNK